MDILAALDNQLVFVRWFYLTARAPFEALLKKHMRDEESENWQKVQKGVEVLGQSSLSLVEKAILDYLRHFILRQVGKVPDDLRGKSKFDKYETFLLTRTTFQWCNCPVGRDRIEQINLCRNDFQHDPDIDG
ncbi:MAG: hypothetical protein M3Y24_13445, partial [Acidobacteriota bacterium]|nr:hypothetical protein [Acidobacteriota bacterium]